MIKKGNILEAIKNVEKQLNESLGELNIKDENRQYIICGAKRLRDNDIQVQILMKMNMRAVALKTQIPYARDISCLLYTSPSPRDS